MSRLLYNLPPLTSLAVFETAARHQSFKRAASEMNVTPSAVSHQIRALETELNTALFQRVHRGVDLTEDGETLYQTVRTAFLDIANQTDAMRSKSDQRGVTVGSTTAMSSLWLTPEISRFWRTNPEMRVNQIVSDRLDFGNARPELVISYGPYNTNGYTGHPLFRDQLLPVCAPALAKDWNPQSPNDLAKLPLIHLDAPDKRWTSWALWFDELGYSGPLRRGIVVNNYMIALQAAEDGVGMVLGWKHLVAPYLASGRLVSFDAFATPAPTSFFLSMDTRATKTLDAEALRDWIQSRSYPLLGE